MMMKLVHVGCHNNPTESFIDFGWQTNISMGEIGESWGNDSVKNIKSEGNANQDNHDKD